MSAFRDAVTPQDWPRLAAYLHDAGLAFDLAVPPRQFAGGLANLNYLVRVDGQDVVLRRPPPGPLAEGANDMAREWRVLSRLHACYPLAPKGVHFCDDVDVIGAPFQLIEYRPGIAIGGALPAGFPPAGGAALTATLVNAMAALHAVDPGAVGLDTLGRPEGFLGRQVEGWARRAEAVWPDGVPYSVRRIVSRLRAGVPADGPAVLLHSDFKFDNMLVDPATLAATAVIDWDMATRGDPMFDLAVLLSYWIEPGDPAPLHTLAQVPSLDPGFPTRAEVASAYFAAANRPAQPLDFHLALARFRLAVAWMQLFRRSQAGALAGNRYAGFETLAHAILGHVNATF
jgi:aminoglycoside phosphotransferase (APT) family kinase protein